MHQPLGPRFSSRYRRLRGLKAECANIPVLALTATATRQVAGDIIRQLGKRKPAGFKGSFFRSNLVITAHKKAGEGSAKRDMRRDILSLIRRHAGDSGIVYCISRRAVESLAAWLAERGVKAAPYHAGLDVRHMRLTTVLPCTAPRGWTRQQGDGGQVQGLLLPP